MKKYIYIVTLFSIFNVFSQDLSESYTANDLAQRPMQDLAKPDFLKAVSDPSFPGTSIRRISEATSGKSIVPMYSTIQSWNADESLLLVYAVGSGHKLLNGTDYTSIRDLSDIRPDDLEAVFWHFTNPDILFYMDNNTDDLIRYNVITQSKTVLANMRALSGCNSGASITSGNDVQMMSWDSDVFSFRCGNTSAYYYRISTGTLTEFNISNINYTAPMPFPSGNLFYHNRSVYDTNGDFVRDLNIAGGEHSCLGKLSNGDDAYYAISFAEGPNGGCLGTLVAHNATTGNCFAVTPTEDYGYSKSGTHISALAHKNSEDGWVAVSSLGFEKDGVQILDQELFIAKVNEFDGNVYRVAHHRSDTADISYWGEPHVTISPSGTRLLFGSDWSGAEDGESIDAYVAELSVYGEIPEVEPEVDSDGDGFSDGIDCDDTNPDVNPDAEEVCDGIDNNCDGLIDDQEESVTCDSTDNSANLLEATYLQESTNPSPTGDILRAEQGNRVTYMKFDLSAFEGDVSKAELKMEVASDPGTGILKVFLGSSSNWTERNLIGSNAPTIVGSPLATISGKHSLGQTKVWNLDVSQLSTGSPITLILQHSNGNDVAFASDETPQAPKLIFTTGEVIPVDADGDGFFNDVDCDDTNPAVNPEAEESCDGIDNNCDGIIDDQDSLVRCTALEISANLVDATYLQWASNPNPKGPILRVEEGKRQTYLKFDLGNFNNPISNAELKMEVASDPGNGTIAVYLGSDTSWTENGLTGTNKPIEIGSPLAIATGNHNLGQTKTWNLDTRQLPTSGLVTLIVKHSSGNDVAFASDESNQAPRLIVASETNTIEQLNTLIVLPNPASVEVEIGFEESVKVSAIFVYDLNGKLIHSVPASEVQSVESYQMNIENFPSGIYFVKTFDATGIPHQKKMVINR